MNRRDRATKLARRHHHSRQSKADKKQALHDAAWLGKNGQPLKKERKGKEFTAAMERIGYLPNGRGGWRKIQKSYAAAKKTPTKGG